MATSTQKHYMGTLLEALNPVRDVTQNWGIDLAQHLETYLEQIAIEHGTNFAEAALLIQNSAVIYVKKVDYVWAMTQQLLENLHKKKSAEDNQKNTNLQTAIDGENSETANNNNKKKKSTGADDLEKSKYGEINIQFPEKPLELDPSKEKKLCRFSPDVYHQFQKRPLATKQKFFNSEFEDQEDRKYKSNQMLLSKFILNHEFQEDNCHSGCIRQSFFTYDIDEPMDVVDDGPMDDEPLNDPSVPLHNDPSVPPLNDPSVPPPSVPHLPVPHLSVPPLNDSSVPPHNCETEELRNAAAHRDKKGDNIVSVVPTANPWVIIPMAEETLETHQLLKTTGKNKVDKLPCHPDLLTSMLKRKGCEGSKKIDKAQSIIPQYIVNNVIKNKKLVLNAEFLIRKRDLKRTKAKTRRFELIRFSLDKNFDEFANFLGFEDYEPLPGETGGFIGFDNGSGNNDDEDDAVDFDNNLPDTVEDCRSPILPLLLPSNDDDDAHIELPDRQESHDVQYENLCIETVPKITNEECVQTQLDLAKRVSQWHESIRPKLALAEKRGHFDIHEYGTRILNTFTQETGQTTLRFQQVVQNVETHDVARYFLASLQLANTYNIKVTTPKDALSMDRVSLTFLSSQRHHEQLEDYVAPSQEEGVQGPCTSSRHMAQHQKKTVDKHKKQTQSGKRRML